MSEAEVFAAFAGPKPGEIDYRDVLDADPAPRELGSAARRYLRQRSTYAWVVLLILFMTLPGVIMAAAVPSVMTIAWALVFVAGTVWLARATSRKRALLRKVAVEGTQHPARIANVTTLVMRQGLFIRRTRTTIVLEVAGGVASCTSWMGELDDLRRGDWLRALVHPDAPGIVIPVSCVT